MYGLDCLGTGEIEGNRTLTPVIELEGVADGESLAEIGVPDLCAEGVALQGFHFDNVGAHVGHHGGTGGNGEPIGNLEDSDTFEGRFHVTASGS